MALWMQWVKYVRARPGETIELEFLRDGNVEQTLLVPDAITGQEGEVFGRVGLGVALPEMPAEMLRVYDRGPIEALVAGVRRTGDLSLFTLISIKLFLWSFEESLEDKP